VQTLPAVQDCCSPCASSSSEVSVPVLDLNIESEDGNIIIEWANLITPESIEIWRSIDGSAFSLMDTIDGNIGTLTDEALMASGEERCYEVRSVSGALQSAFSNIVCAVNDMIYPGTTPSEPFWLLAFGDFASDDGTLVTSLSFPALKRVTGNLFVDATLVLASANFDALQIVNKGIYFSLSNLASISLPSLEQIDGGPPVLVQYNGITPEMMIPAFYCDQSVNLTAISLPNLVFENGKIYAFDSCALSVASVEHILARMLASNPSHMFATLDGGTNAGYASISALGKSNYDLLVANGNSVSIN